uniref:Uncharacterized protein n=1 Tax=Ditylenchus dipsaci TaxID=166011 RepID=A0A915EEZ2_9BILA
MLELDHNLLLSGYVLEALKIYGEGASAELKAAVSLGYGGTVLHESEVDELFSACKVYRSDIVKEMSCVLTRRSGVLDSWVN